MRTLEERLSGITFNDISEQQPDWSKTRIERASPEDMTPLQRDWVENGYVIIKNFLPRDLIEKYCRVRDQLPKDRSAKDNFWGGWHFPTSYQVCQELKEISLFYSLFITLKELIGDDMGLHLCLTGWVSTERDWHQDTYLNPPPLWSYYAAVWFALDDISRDSGPFQFIPGSHNWNVIRQEKLFKYLTDEEKTSPHWPTFTQDHVARVCMQEFERRGGRVEEFVPEKGDILIWHSNLVHRGSKPKDPSLLRKALICHYSGVEKRSRIDMPKYEKAEGGYFFDLPVAGEVRP